MPTLKDRELAAQIPGLLAQHGDDTVHCLRTDMDVDAFLADIARWRCEGATGALVCSEFELEALRGHRTGIYLQQELDVLSTETGTETLSEASWQAQAVTLYAYTNRSLHHDFKNSLNTQDNDSAREIWRVLQARLGALRQRVKAECATVEQALAQKDLHAVHAAWRQLWQKLNTHVDTPQLARAVAYLSRHWPALLEEQKTLKHRLKHELKPLSLSAELSTWLKQYSYRRLKQPLRVLRAAESLKTLRPQLAEPLQRLIHNTVGQHLFAVAAVLERWLPVSQHYAPDLRELTPDNLHLWRQLLPVPQWVGSWAASPEVPYAVLVLEDNPVWMAHVLDVLRDFSGLQIHCATCISQAKTLLDNHAFDVVLTDLALPLTPGAEPLRQHGIAFLQDSFSRYLKTPPRLLVHTTPTYFLPDQLALNQVGLRHADYIIKGSPEVLTERLQLAFAALETPPAFDLQIHDQHRVLNGVVLSLSELSGALLDSLAHHGPLTPTQLLQHLVHRGYTRYAEELEAVAVSPFSEAVLWRWLDKLKISGSLRTLDADLQTLLLQQLQQLLAAFQAEQFAEIPARFKDNAWLTQQLLREQVPALFKRVQAHAFPTSHPRQQLANKVSKMLHDLKEEVYASALAVQQPIDVNTWLQKDASGRYGLQHSRIQQRHIQQQGSPQREPFSAAVHVLLIEDNPVHAEDMQQLLTEMARYKGWELRLHHLTHLNALDAFLQRGHKPDLVLLDLHLPASATSNAHPQNGYVMLERLREHFGELSVIVTSTLVHEDALRTEGLRLGVPLSHFVPKGETLEQLPWPESLRLNILRRLQAQRDQGQRPELPALSPFHPHLPALKLSVVACDDQQITLDIRSGSQKEAVRVVHKNHYARWLRELLRRPGLPVSAHQLSAAKATNATYINNTRNRLRQQMRKQWPVAPESVNDLLYQQTLQNTRYFTLQVAQVYDPRGLLADAYTYASPADESSPIVQVQSPVSDPDSGPTDF